MATTRTNGPRSKSHQENQDETNHGIPTTKQAKVQIAKLEAMLACIHHLHMDERELIYEERRTKTIDGQTYTRSMNELEKNHRASVARIGDEIRRLREIASRKCKKKASLKLIDSWRRPVKVTLESGSDPFNQN